MSRRPARATQADLNRAGKTAKALGMAVEVKPDGTIRLVPVENSGEAPKASVGQEREIVL